MEYPFEIFDDRLIRCNDKKDGENLREQCLRAEQIATYIEGKLTPEEQTIVEHHLSECSHCRKILEITIKSLSEVPTPFSPNSTMKS
jgi:putative zinc finger protein